MTEGRPVMLEDRADLPEVGEEPGTKQPGDHRR